MLDHHLRPQHHEHTIIKLTLPEALGLQYRIGVCTPAVHMYTCTINGGDLSAVNIVNGWKVKGETIHLHLIINIKSTCSCSAISFFPNQDGVVWYFFLNKYSFIPEKK